MLPLKLEILLKGIALSVGIFYFLLIEHIKKQITTQCRLLIWYLTAWICLWPYNYG